MLRSNAWFFLVSLSGLCGEMTENRYNRSRHSFGTLTGGAAVSLALSTGCSRRDWEGGINCGETHRATACIPQIIRQRNSEDGPWTIDDALSMVMVGGPSSAV